MISLWTAVLAGVFTLLGGCLTFFTSRSLQERQAKEARKARKVAQLERLNKVLEKEHASILSICAAATATIALSERQLVEVVEDVSIAEIEFLARVYLSGTNLYLAEIKHFRREFVQIFSAVCSAPPGAVVKEEVLARLDEMKWQLDDSVEHLRQALVEAVRELEES